jgi:hypothetical protein
MTIHQRRSFSENRIAGNIETFPIEKREPAAEAEPQGTRAEKFAVFAVLAFVVGLLAALTSSALRYAPETAGADQTLTAMYGP